jgi:hypothetical protein
MSKSQKKSKRAYVDFTSLSPAEQVQLAMPCARRVIHEGITEDPTPGRAFEDDVLDLASDERLRKQWASGSESDYVPLARGFAAARAIGIALGLMLRGNTFLAGTKGGAR